MAEALITQLTNLFRQDLDSSSNAATVQMASAWLKVEQDLFQDILELATELSPDGQPLKLTPTKLNRFQRYVRLLAQLQKEMERFTGQTATPIIQQLQANSAFAGIQQALTLIDATVSLSGGSAVDFTFDRLNVEAVQNIVAISGAGKPLDDLLQAAYPVAAGGITSELITGIAKGQNPRVVARNIVKQGLSQGLNHILLVARDQMLRAQKEGTRQQYKQSGVVLAYRRTAALQPRTCAACLALDGEVISVDKPMPVHPQCRCTAIPIIIGLFPLKLESGADWFNKQPESVQQEILGKGKFEAYKAGRFEFKDIAKVTDNPVWGPSTKVRTIQELEEMGG